MRLFRGILLIRRLTLSEDENSINLSLTRSPNQYLASDGTYVDTETFYGAIERAMCSGKWVRAWDRTYRERVTNGLHSI